MAIVSRFGYSNSVSCVINGGDFNTEILAVNKVSSASNILTITNIGINHGVQKYNATVTAKGVTVSEYQPAN